MKISCKKAKSLLSEERRTSKEYHSYGFHSQARDESRHSKFFRKKAKEIC